MIGRALAHYEILQRLGAGGMGEVYLARDTHLNREIALKVLLPEASHDAEQQRRFEREAKVLAALNHPNIVTVHSVEEAEGICFLTMERVEGETLAARIPRRGMATADFLWVALPIADALAVAHESGIIHRDLKPGNVIVTPDRRVKILDFGLAKHLGIATDLPKSQDVTEPMTQAGRVLGTIPYMSPEQLQGKAVDARSDIFSLGVMLYEMATGERPFKGDTSIDLGSSILRDVPAPVDTVRAGLPPQLTAIIRRCLEKDPQRRYQSTRDIRNELDELSADQANDTARSAAALDRTPSRRRSPLGWGIPLLGATLVLGVLWLSGRLNRDRSSPSASSNIDWLAVLPFDTPAGDADQQSFSQGMHLSLIENLAKIRAVNVKAFASMARYAGSDLSLAEIARELEVQALIKGSFWRGGETNYIHVELIRGEHEQVLWSASFNRDLKNVLSLVDEVSRGIAAALRLRLTPGEQSILTSGRTVDPKAFELYLEARRVIDLDMSSPRARELFKQAADLDPTFAPAWAGLGAAHFLSGFFGPVPLDEAVGLARDCAKKALELDPGCGPAHAGLATIQLYVDRDFKAAHESFQRALALRPNHSWIRHGYADYLMIMGDPGGSVEQVKLGRQYDPASLTANVVVVAHLIMAERYDEAIDDALNLLRRFPDESRQIQGWLATALWHAGRHRDAIEAYRESWGAESKQFTTLAQGFDDGGPEAAMRALAGYLAAEFARGGGDTIFIARIYAAGGDADRTFHWLSEASKQASPHMVHVVFFPEFRRFHSDPRWSELLRRIGVPFNSVAGSK